MALPARRNLPTNGELLTLAAKYPSDSAMARALGVPRRTLGQHIDRQGARESINALRGHSPVEVTSEVPVIRRDYSHLDRLFVYPLGDIHKGAAEHRADRWRQWLNYLEERPNTSMIGTGDFLNSALKDSKSEAYDEKMRVGQAKREVIRELKFLADEGRLDVLMPGNHEDRIYRAVGDCPIQDIADMLSVPYTQAACLLVYKVGDIEYEVYVRHGTGNGQSLAQLAKSGSVIRADVYVTGHTHKQAVTIEDIFVRDTRVDRIGRHKRYFVSSGSFLGYETYAAARGYPPSHLGGPRIRLDGRVWDTHVSI
jgi:predicted phosphodiesterase